jgi:hypothetical protein
LLNVIVTVTLPPAFNPDAVKVNKPYGKLTLPGGGVEILPTATGEKLDKK